MSAPRAFLRPERRFLLASGADSVAWWQGQATNEMRVAPGEPVAFCLVEATGQLRAVVDGIRIGIGESVVPPLHGRGGRGGVLEEPELEATPLNPPYRAGGNSDDPRAFLFVTENPEVVLQRVQEYVILEDVQIELLDGVVATILTDEKPDRLSVPVPGGYDILLPEDHGMELESEEILLTERLAQGIPQIGTDTSERTLPPELGPWFEQRYIHYAKGCYMGQEVLQRIHSRGHVNRVWCVLALPEPAPIATPVMNERGERVGAVTQCRNHPEQGWLAGAFIKREATDQPLLINDQPAKKLF